MYSYGDDFSYEIDGSLEYFTCLTTIRIKEEEYIVAENEFGHKKVFLIEDEDEEIIREVDEEDEETIINIYERQTLLDPDFYITDDDNYDDIDDDDDEFEEFIPKDLDDAEFDEDLEDIEDIEIDDIFDEIFNEED